MQAPFLVQDVCWTKHAMSITLPNTIGAGNAATVTHNNIEFEPCKHIHVHGTCTWTLLHMYMYACIKSAKGYQLRSMHTVTRMQLCYLILTGDHHDKAGETQWQRLVTRLHTAHEHRHVGHERHASGKLRYRHDDEIRYKCLTFTLAEALCCVASRYARAVGKTLKVVQNVLMTWFFTNHTHILSNKLKPNNKTVLHM